MSVYPYSDPASGFGGGLGRSLIDRRPKSARYAPNKKTGKSGKAPPKRPLTMEEWAEQQAEKRVQAEVDAIRAQQAIFEKERAAAYQRQIEQAKGLAAMIQSMGFDKAIQGVYSGAASDLGGLASGFAGETRGIAAADAAAQRNMLSGTGQEGAVRDQGGNMGDVLYGVGGWIPGKALGEQGAAYAANAALQPAFTLQQGAVEAQRAFDESSGQLSDFALAIAEAKAGKFSYKEELLQYRQKAAIDQQKLRIQQFEDDRDFWLKKQALYLSQGKHKLAQQAEKRAAAYERRRNFESQGRDFEGNPMPGYTVGRNGNLIPPGYKEDKKGNIVKQYAPKSKASAKNKYTPTQQASMIETIIGKEEDIKADIVKAVRAGEWAPASGNTKARAALGRRIYKKYAHLAGTYKPARLRLEAIIRELLLEASRFGPPAPGGGGDDGGVWD